jgi:hypothetical protein
MTMQRSSHPWLAVGAAAALAALALAPGLAQATTVTDPVGDFLPTYTGPLNGDMDVIAAGAVINGTDITFTANFDGTIGTTVGGLYVLGINRGGGLPLLTAGSPSVGAGVNFDAVAVLRPTGGSTVNIILPTALAPIALPTVTFSGSSLRAVIPLADLPSNGFTPAQYLFNLWPRDGLGSNVQIADFAPNASSFAASAPEPGAWALMVLGFGALGAMLRRRRTGLAPA